MQYDNGFAYTDEKPLYAIIETEDGKLFWVSTSQDLETLKEEMKERIANLQPEEMIFIMQVEAMARREP